MFCNTRLVPDTRRPEDKSCLTSESFQKFLSVFNIYLEKVLSQTSVQMFFGTGLRVVNQFLLVSIKLLKMNNVEKTFYKF